MIKDVKDFVHSSCRNTYTNRKQLSNKVNLLQTKKYQNMKVIKKNMKKRNHGKIK